MEQTIFKSIVLNPWGHQTLWIIVLLLVAFVTSMKERMLKFVVLVFGLPWFSVTLYHILTSLGIEFIETHEDFWYFKISLPVVILVIQPLLFSLFYSIRVVHFRRKIWIGKRAGNPTLKYKKMGHKLEEIKRVRAAILKNRKPDERAQEKLNRELQMAYKEVRPDLSFISALIEQGADVNSRDAEGMTSLHVTTDWMNRKSSLILFLIGAGADPNIRNEEGKTALIYYASRNGFKVGHQYAVEVLATYTDLNIKDNDGKTALFYRAGNSSDNRLSFLLLKLGADVHFVDNLGKSILDYAAEGQNRKLVTYLKKKGIKK